MIVRFENVKVTKPFINYSSRRRNSEAGHGRVTLEFTFQAMVHAADLQRLAEGGSYAVTFTPMSEIVKDAEATDAR